MLDQLNSAADVVPSPPTDSAPAFADRPSLFALYRSAVDATHGTGTVIAWVVALTDGTAVLLPVGDPVGDPIRTTIHSARRRWAPLWDAELIAVDDAGDVHLAA